MNTPPDRESPDRRERDLQEQPDGGANTIQPLPGEAGIPNVAGAPRQPMSKKGLLTLALLFLSVVAVLGFWIARFAASGHNADAADTRLAGDRPTAATAEPRKLDMTPAPAARPPASSAAGAATRIPALVPTPEEAAEPIGVRRTGQTAPASGTKSISPEDAPVLLVSSRPGLGTAQTTPPRCSPASCTAPRRRSAGKTMTPARATCPAAMADATAAMTGCTASPAPRRPRCSC